MSPSPYIQASDLSDADRDRLVSLAGQVAEIATLPVHKQKAELWRRCNDLDSVRPMVWINEICWQQMNVDDELTPRCEHPWARNVEGQFLRELYQWRHLPADMILSDALPSPLAVRRGSLGLTQKGEYLPSDPDRGGVVSQHFDPQITGPEDVNLIQDPVVTHDEQASEAEFQARSELFGHLMPVRREGIKHLWFAPWDELIRVWGVEQAMMDLVLRPEMVHAIVGRYVEASLKMLDQLEALNLLSINSDNTRIGSGGYAYTSELPGPGCDSSHPRTGDLWGCAAAQIFSEVSPEMHWEFALKHEIRWLERWGLTYYGCCEPMDNKLEFLRRVPNLRKISMSPWVKPARAAELVGQDYVYSLKPNPAILAEDTWRPGQARKELIEALEPARDCHVEIILKDISTVRDQPQRLWEWAEMAMEVAEDFTK